MTATGRVTKEDWAAEGGEWEVEMTTLVPEVEEWEEEEEEDSSTRRVATRAWAVEWEEEEGAWEEVTTSLDLEEVWAVAMTSMGPETKEWVVVKAWEVEEEEWTDRAEDTRESAII